MRRSLFSVSLMIALTVAALPASARDDTAARNKVLDAPPPGIVATSATLADVLKQHDAAIGRHPGLRDWRRETWSRTDYGFAGTETLVRHGSDYRSTISHGPFVEEYGQRDGKRWHKTANGTVYAMSAADEQSFAMFRVLEDAADPKNDAKLLGEAPAPQPAYVVEVRSPQRKHPEWIYYDKTSGLVARTESSVANARKVAVFDDYRKTEGFSEPWHVRDTLTEQGLEDDFKRTSLVAADAEPALFDAPASSFAPGGFDKPGLVAGKVIDGTVTVRLTVNGRGLDFELFSGAPNALIDREVARELNLPTFGQTIMSKTGVKVGYDTELSEARIGEIGFLRHFAVRAVNFNYITGYGTKVAPRTRCR